MTAVVRLAEPRDLTELAAFEVRIAEISFGPDAVTDPQVHHKKLAKALDRDRESMFVAEESSTADPMAADPMAADPMAADPMAAAAAGGRARLAGWLWLAVNTNFLTGQRYANFRSLAVAPHAPAGTAEALLEHALGYARDQRVTEVVGRVHVDNVAMRLLYRRYGFEPAFLTMRWRDDDR